MQDNDFHTIGDHGDYALSAMYVPRLQIGGRRSAYHVCAVPKAPGLPEIHRTFHGPDGVPGHHARENAPVIEKMKQAAVADVKRRISERDYPTDDEPVPFGLAS